MEYTYIYTNFITYMSVPKLPNVPLIDDFLISLETIFNENVDQ